MKFDKETQERILRVAADRNQGKDMEEVDESIAYIMDMHPEFDQAWEMGEMAVYPQEIEGKVVNPFVHTVLHVIVDQQIRDEAPDFVAQAYKDLVDMGIDQHEVLHHLISVYADLYFTTFRRGDNFSNLDYQERIKQLVQAAKEGMEEG
ncbi:conserved hypothetical protein [Nitrospina gracilis 3/211]|uniref:DUF1841 domain-containing protein n=1 Tax=Nitrospina gracilis (strain 3/211) TaxID=1266370 RepID=M1YN73_NITG3|nr:MULTISPECIES: DUF1841 family protein [Nitrospina]MCF8724686.1 hypothetical protein [Nitrospina sp. Nb-3]CCQ91957.1 conserved hypothetical protein [Nitrospina gracilis 3/211]